MLLIAEREGIFFHGGNPFWIFVKGSKISLYAFYHSFGLYVTPYEGMTTCDFRKASERCHKNSLSELHGLNGRQSESLSLAWEEKCLAMGIEPDALFIGYLTRELHIGYLFSLNSVADERTCLEMVIAADIKIVFGKFFVSLFDGN